MCVVFSSNTNATAYIAISLYRYSHSFVFYRYTGFFAFINRKLVFIFHFILFRIFFSFIYFVCEYRKNNVIIICTTLPSTIYWFCIICSFLLSIEILLIIVIYLIITFLWRMYFYFDFMINFEMSNYLIHDHEQKFNAMMKGGWCEWINVEFWIYNERDLIYTNVI